ncbi:hypothetical protein [Erwinia endophytica]|nr:hypothetical protein [Erwinia endophytica]
MADSSRCEVELKLKDGLLTRVIMAVQHHVMLTLMGKIYVLWGE